MYERNAKVIDKYFSNMFGYDRKNNIKVNSANYFELVERLEEYQKICEKENNIMDEFDNVANRIKETQELQDVLKSRSEKYNEEIKELFENLDENTEELQKRIEAIQNDIEQNNIEIKDNSQAFIQELQEFNEKSETRNQCGIERKEIEAEYTNILNETTENIENLDKKELKDLKAFIKQEDKTEQKNELKEKVLKNGEKEKIPFDENVVSAAIDISSDIEEKRVSVLLSVYDKTTKLLNEIKNDAIDIEKHKKIVKDAKSKLEFLDVITDYIVLFLDNERMSTVGGLEEHQRVMKEASDNLRQDLIQIINMYSLLTREMTGKATDSEYKEQYRLEYLYELQDQEKEFEENVKKLNLRGTIIYPDYWRLEGMQKVFDAFRNIMRFEYEKDLTVYEPISIICAVNEDILDVQDEENKELEENQDIDENEISEEYENQEEEQEEVSEAPSESDFVEYEESEFEEDNSSDEADENIEEAEEIENEEVEENDDFEWEDEEDEGLDFGEVFSTEDDEQPEENEEKEEEGQELNLDDEELTIDEEDFNIATGNQDFGYQNYEEYERDKEIDKILGVFDGEDEEVEENKEEDAIFDFNSDEEEKIEEASEQEENQEQDKEKEEDEEEEEEKPKRRGLFGRRRK